MLCRRSRGWFVKTLPFAIAAGSVAASAACAVDFSTKESSVNPTPALSDIDAGGAGDVASADSGAAADGAASLYQGSPLCNWSNASSSCDPDLPVTVAPQTCLNPYDPPAPADAGASDAGTSASTYRCYVAVDTRKGTTQWCSQAGRGADGDACQTGDNCAPGYECVGTGVCRHYCCDLHECEKMNKVTFCDVQTSTGGHMTAADTRVPVCMPVRSCKLLLPGYCETSETCAPVRTDGTTSCVAVGPAKAGESCERDHCDKDLACLGAPGNRSCYQLCHTDSMTECPTGKKCKTSSAQFVDPTIGVCE